MDDDDEEEEEWALQNPARKNILATPCTKILMSYRKFKHDDYDDFSVRRGTMQEYDNVLEVEETVENSTAPTFEVVRKHELQVLVSGFPLSWGEGDLLREFKSNVTESIQSCLIYRDKRGKSQQMGRVRFREAGMVERALERMENKLVFEDVYDASTLSMSRKYYTLLVQRDCKE